jgi:hypothetical protein
MCHVVHYTEFRSNTVYIPTSQNNNNPWDEIGNELTKLESIFNKNTTDNSIQLYETTLNKKFLKSKAFRVWRPTIIDKN